LEAVLKETERQRREFAARYAFMTLDTDGDGYVSIEQVGRERGPGLGTGVGSDAAAAESTGT
jgi:hypothetical protein